MGGVVVTGAASGLGRAVAERLRKEGRRVFGVDVADAEILGDLGRPDGRAAVLDAIRARCDGALDGVVSCAGLGPYEDAGPVARVNYFGAVAMLDELKEELARGDAPAAVAISSMGGIFDQLAVPAFLEACHAGDEEAAVAALAGRDGNTAYVNAKRALAQAVRRRAAEWGGRGIRLNAVAPGKMETPMLARLRTHETLGAPVEALPVALGRSAPPEEIASAVVFLLGADAGYIHGQVLFVDGGSEALVRGELF